MPTLEKSIVIEAPIHEVFKYASDWRYWPDWYYGFADVSPKTEVERGNGAIYAYRMWVLGIPCILPMNLTMPNKAFRATPLRVVFDLNRLTNDGTIKLRSNEWGGIT
jgi:hypothetical protein